MAAFQSVRMSRRPTHQFARALRELRVARGMPQEAFDQVSGRTYVSALERGLKQPTLTKVDELAAAMEIHPLTLLLASYCRNLTPDHVRDVCAAVQQELSELLSSVPPAKSEFKN